MPWCRLIGAKTLAEVARNCWPRSPLVSRPTALIGDLYDVNAVQQPSEYRGDKELVVGDSALPTA